MGNSRKKTIRFFFKLNNQHIDIQNFFIHLNLSKRKKYKIQHFQTFLNLTNAYLKEKGNDILMKGKQLQRTQK